jgi:putative RNA 2'-phosphotransferase
MNDITKTSKFLSYVLRHNPADIGVELDEHGWVNINELIDKSNNKGRNITRELLDEVVQTNDKQRFAISKDGLSIRANQGHSLKINLDLPPLSPPTILLHGTAKKSIAAIRANGLKKMARHHVHLTENREVASAVGKRYGKLIMLEIDSEKMFEDGFIFFKTANGVWLVESVPVEYIKESET